jgi:hypothetical protein
MRKGRRGGDKKRYIQKEKKREEKKREGKVRYVAFWNVCI